MKRMFLAWALASSPAAAQVIECPRQHEGMPLIGGGMYEGPGKEYELAGAGRKVRGGVDVGYGFTGGEVKWLACWYGKGEAVLWRQVSLSAKKCDLQERRSRGGEVKVTLDCK